MAKLKLEICKFCVVNTFTNIKKFIGAIVELKKVLGEFGETPYEPLKEEQEDGGSETMIKKQVNALNSTLINFFRGNAPNAGASSSSNAYGECQICKKENHLTIAYPRLNESQPKCTKCGMSHKTQNCEIKCIFSLGVGHSK